MKGRKDPRPLRERNLFRLESRVWECQNSSETWVWDWQKRGFGLHLRTVLLTRRWARVRSSCLRFKRELGMGYCVGPGMEPGTEDAALLGAHRRDTGIGKSGRSMGLGAQMKAGQRPGLFRH